jgi:hypothetical protein
MSLLAVILAAAGTALAVVAGVGLARRLLRRRRRHRAELEALANQGRDLWEHFDAPPSRHPATRIQHGAGAVAYFASRQHNHRPGQMCGVDGCNWPLR